jgi:hypothetical protein
MYLLLFTARNDSGEKREYTDATLKITLIESAEIFDEQMAVLGVAFKITEFSLCYLYLQDTLKE